MKNVIFFTRGKLAAAWDSIYRALWGADSCRLTLRINTTGLFILKGMGPPWRIYDFVARIHVAHA
jgi:hypothetical protein